MNFCELGPFAYALSSNRQILQRHLKNLFGKERYPSVRSAEALPVVVSSFCSDLIKRGPDIDPQLQLNKVDNITTACSKFDGLVINPGESFSFWHYVGKTTQKNGFKAGRVLKNGRLVAGMGGGLCNLANSLHLAVMHSPMTITELHHHSDALSPDPDGKRVPYSAGTSVNYNYLDFRFRNDTSQPVQLLARVEDNHLSVEVRSEKEFPFVYEIVEEGHHFRKERDGSYYRVSNIFRLVKDRQSGEVIQKELKWNNHSKVMFDPSLLPQDFI